MANIINSLLLGETTTNTNTISSTSEQTVKDKPSLFDSLLSNNTVIKEENVMAKTIAIIPSLEEVKIEEKLSGEDLEINSEMKVDNTQLKNIEIEPEKVEIEKTETGKIEEQKLTSTTSLLDRLIIEAKKNVKETIIPEKIKQNSLEIEVESTNNKDIPIISKENITANNLGIKDIVDIVIPTEIKQELDTLIIPKENVPQIVIFEEIKQDLGTLIIPKENSNSSDLNIKIKEQKVNGTDILLEQIVTKTQNGVSTQEVVGSDIKVLTENETLNPILNSSMDLNTDNISNVKESPLLSLPITTTEVVEENIVKQESLIIKKEEKLSLMDQLILKNNEKLTLDTIDSNIPAPLKDVVTKDLISSIYLGSQKNKVSSQVLFNRNEAVNFLKDGNSIQAVKTSAEILELGLEDMTIEQNLDIDIDEIEVKKIDIQALSRKNQIDNLFLDKNVKSEEVKNLIIQSVAASSALLDSSLNLADDATITVNSPLSFNLQSKIIGAKQQMSTMMSDIAKQMYENYKPPMTAFRININPSELGSIAILMKNDRNNGLTISMNITNNVTLNTLIENQNILRNSLNKTFDEGTNFNLDFSSSNQNSSNQSSNANEGQSNNRRFEQRMDTQSVLQLKEENRDIEEKSIDYM